MDIELHKITVRKLAEGFREGDYDEGVVGYGGNLDIRPPYQREFIYEGKQQEAVIKTALKGYPLNIMYWSDNGGGKYEVMDGQQRTISLCRFVQPGGFSVDIDERPMTFSVLPEDKQKKLLNYELFVYFCTGNESEKLDWFQTINIAGEELEEQEIRNAIYCGTWVTDAKRYFSRPGRGAAHLADGYHSAKVKRQELLEAAIKWVWNIREDDEICRRMGQEGNKPNANELWLEFQKIIAWAKATFPDHYNEMAKVDWGALYHAHGKKKLNPAKLAKRVRELMMDPDITDRRGVFTFVLDGDERNLNIRRFNEREKAAVWEKQGRKCGYRKAPISPKCTGESELPLKQAHADHYTPWRDGGKTEIKNCVVACRHCNLAKGAK